VILSRNVHFKCCDLLFREEAISFSTLIDPSAFLLCVCVGCTFFSFSQRRKLEKFGMKLIKIIQENAQKVNNIVNDAKKKRLTKKQFIKQLNAKVAANKDGNITH
jgi:hypothetical protein